MKECREPSDLGEITKSPLGNPVRLAIALYLLPRQAAYFSTIAKALGLSPGNLRHHLNVMLQHDLIEEKYVIEERPRKLIILTMKGARELNKVLVAFNKLFSSGQG
ncbi:MAG: helix-turn-helix domain-containing protein [Desulfurococcales archaeon]|nr:helix-turn-helix domain-containing protein [Desulfurococcales archaeon]